MNNDFRAIGEQVLSGVFMTLWLLSRPFVWTYSLLKWFTVSVFKETGNRLVKIASGALAISIIGLATQYLIG